MAIFRSNHFAVFPYPTAPCADSFVFSPAFRPLLRVTLAMTCTAQADEVVVVVSQLGKVLEMFDVMDFDSLTGSPVPLAVLALVVVTLEDRRALAFPFGCEIERVRFVLHCIE